MKVWMVFLLVLAVFAAMVRSASGQTTTRVSVGPGGAQGNGQSYITSISGNGRYVAFSSDATNFVPSNGLRHIFVHDLQTGLTTIASVDSNGVRPTGHSSWPSISQDGRFVVFNSDAINLVAGDTNNRRDTFVHDRLTGITTRVSVDSSGAQSNGDSTDYPSISADGRFVAFGSSGSNLVSGDTNGVWDIFVHDRETGQTTRVSVDSNGAQSNGGSNAHQISGDGRYVAFQSNSSNLVSGDTGGFWDTFVHDRLTGITTLVSVSSNGTQANGHSSEYASISSDGRFVAFCTNATNLVSGDTNGQEDIFVHDNLLSATVCASVSSSGIVGNDTSRAPSISADGRYVAFSSVATNLVPGGTSNRQIFVHDLQTGGTTIASVSSNGVQGNFPSNQEIFPPPSHPSISSNASVVTVVFDSSATNLVSGDTNDQWDVFTHDFFGSSLCADGNVDSGPGTATNVLRVNGSFGDANRIVTVPLNTSITVSLDWPPAGPASPRNLVWVWQGMPTNSTDLTLFGQTIGCTVNPTRFSPGQFPYPIYSFSTVVPTDYPLALLGFSSPVTYTLQGVMGDVGAGNPTGLSVTNAVILRVQ